MFSLIRKFQISLVIFLFHILVPTADYGAICIYKNTNIYKIINTSGEIQGLGSGKTVSIPVEWVGLEPTISVDINGRPLRLVLDSGANSVALFSDIAARVGVYRAGKAKVIGFGGSLTQQMGFAKSINIDGVINLINSPVVIIDGGGNKFDGVIGLEAFRDYVIDIDFRNSVVVLSDPSNSKKLIASGDGTSIIVPFTFRDGAILCGLKVGGHSSCALIDTGLDWALFNDIGVGELQNNTRPDRDLSSLFNTGIATALEHPMLGGHAMDIRTVSGTFVSEIVANPGNLCLVENYALPISHNLGYLTKGFLEHSDTSIGAVLGMTFLLQFEHVVVDYKRLEMCLIGNQFGAVVHFPNGGTLAQADIQKELPLVGGQSLIELWALGAIEPPLDRSSGLKFIVSSSNGSWQSADEPSSYFTAFELLSGGLTAAFQDVLTIGCGDTLIASPSGMVAIAFKCRKADLGLADSKAKEQSPILFQNGGTTVVGRSILTIPKGGFLLFDRDGTPVGVSNPP